MSIQNLTGLSIRWKKCGYIDEFLKFESCIDPCQNSIQKLKPFLSN